jgi:dUTP pyrophosphatase
VYKRSYLLLPTDTTTATGRLLQSYSPRSGLALHHHIDVGGGILDEDYRGNLGVILYNHSNIPFTVSCGDRIAQLICQKICYSILEEVQILDATERGEGGFGSNGNN